MRKSRQTFYLYLSGNSITLVVMGIGSIMLSSTFLVLLVPNLDAIKGTYRSYYERSARISNENTLQNPNKAGYFNAIFTSSFFIFCIVSIFFVNLSINFIIILIIIIIFIPVPLLYIIGSIIYEDTTIEDKIQNVELSEEGEEILERNKDINEKIDKLNRDLNELEE